MAAVPVIVKHQGKRHEVELDPTSTGETFKYQLYSLTGVEPDRQKILIKGGQLKDDTDLSTLGAKPRQVFMMMGTPAAGADGSAASAISRPKDAIRFVEDMTAAEQARAEGATPAGLQNLGNTCYLNSTLQTLRSVPELQEELAQYKPAPNAAGPSAETYRQFGLDGLGATGSAQDLTASLRDLYKQMAETQEGFPPLVFLQTLRTLFPQFAQRAKNGQGYAQQDAEEAWTQILATLRDKLMIKDTASDGEGSSAEASRPKEPSFVDKYMAGSFETTVACDEEAAKEAGEQPVESSEKFLKLDCHISKETNHLRDGILAALEEQIEKKSPALDREATYTKTSRISRLPKYLTVHFVRFFWKREAQKKAKIMRKVTFPAELDVVEFCTETLRKRLIPVRDKVREIRKDEEDMVRARKRQKIAHKQEQDRVADAAAGRTEQHEPLSKATAKKEEKEKKDSAKDEKVEEKKEKEKEEEEVFKTDEEYEAERAAAVRAATKALHELIDPGLTRDVGANQSGLYELRGVVTHQGASADSGHYTAYVKKQGPVDAATGKRKEDDGKWWWFNDDKVSEVGAEKIETLAGGGESHSALILLYRAVELPTAEEVED